MSKSSRPRPAPGIVSAQPPPRPQNSTRALAHSPHLAEQEAPRHRRRPADRAASRTRNPHPRRPGAPTPHPRSSPATAPRLPHSRKKRLRRRPTKEFGEVSYCRIAVDSDSSLVPHPHAVSPRRVGYRLRKQTTAFPNPPNVSGSSRPYPNDRRHSGEARISVLDLSAIHPLRRLYSVSPIRIISAQPATPAERALYEEA